MKEIVKRVINELNVSSDDAIRITAALLNKPNYAVLLDDISNELSTQRVEQSLKLLKRNMPLEYITEKVQFMDFTLHIKPGVFIPRIETEHLVELIQDQMHTEPQHILELGTGSGAIAIALAHMFPRSIIIATDISSEALQCASMNIKRHHLDDRISCVRCNLFNGIHHRFDLVVSNPPYICSSRLDSLPKSVREFEPVQALDGGHRGIAIIESLIKDAATYIRSSGTIALEIDSCQVTTLRRYLATQGIVSYTFFKDLFGRFRYLMGQF